MGYNYPPKRKRMISQEVLDDSKGATVFSMVAMASPGIFGTR